MSGSGEEHLVNIVKQQLRESAQLKLALVEQAQAIHQIAKMCAAALQRGNKILLCGNGGSAADCQHLAGELVGRFQKERRALPAQALTTDTSILTAVANDYGYQEVFARQVAAYGRAGDVLIGISTSGESGNVIRAVEQAKQLGMVSIAFTGLQGKLRELADYAVGVPSTSTPRLQEAHITVGHIICGLVDMLICSQPLVSPSESAY